MLTFVHDKDVYNEGPSEGQATITNQYSIKELIVVLAFSIILILKGMGVYDGQIPFKIFMPLVLLLFLIKYLIDEHSIKEVIASFILLAIFTAIFFITKNKGYIIGIIMFLGMKDISIKKLFRLGFVPAALSIILNYILAVTGLHIGDVRIHYKLGGEIIRYSLGNSHPNNMHMTYIIACMLILYSLKDDKKKQLRWNIFSFIGSLFLLIYTVSYTGMLLSALLFFGVLYYHYVPTRFTVLDKLIAYSVIAVCTILSSPLPVIATKSYQVFQKINRFFHNRLLLLDWYYGAYDVHIIPQRINDYTKLSYQLDNSLAELLLESGLPVFLLFLIGLMLTINCLSKNNDRLAIIIITIQIVGGMSDPYLFNSSARNLIILWMGKCYFDYLSNYSSNNNISLNTLNKFSNKKLFLPVITSKNNFTKKQKYIVTIITLITSSIITFIIVINKTYPEAYGVALNKYEGEYIENVEGIHFASYSDVADDSNILIYNVTDYNVDVIYINTERINEIDKLRDNLLIYINTCIIIMLTLQTLSRLFINHIFENLDS